MKVWWVSLKLKLLEIGSYHGSYFCRAHRRRKGLTCADSVSLVFIHQCQDVKGPCCITYAYPFDLFPGPSAGAEHQTQKHGEGEKICELYLST
jgi:hypothetical protein